MACLGSTASALSIIPTFGTTSGTPFTAGDIACINQVIALYQGSFTNQMTVHITFNNMDSGLGNSQTAFYQDSYANVHSKLVNSASSSTDDVTALASIAGGNAPVSDTTNVAFSEANGKAMGYLDSDFNPGQDSIIGLRANVCFNVHTAAGAAANPTKYDLFGVTCHELDEALGTVSFVTTSELSIADFWRYNGNGAGVLSGGRIHSTDINAHAWFSLNGSLALNQYNQFQRSGGDWGDWVVHNPFQVQDYAGTPGQIADPNVELRLLDAVGYNRVVPEPGTLAALGLGVVAMIRRRRKV